MNKKILKAVINSVENLVLVALASILFMGMIAIMEGIE